MPSPEFDIWGEDWESAGEEIDALSNDILRLWPDYEDKVIEVLNAPELDVYDCYFALKRFYEKVKSHVDRSKETVEPWDGTSFPSIFDKLSVNDPKPYDWTSEEQQIRTRLFGKRVMSHAMNFGILFGYYPGAVLRRSQNSN